jgi:hypothetical protein
MTLSGMSGDREERHLRKGENMKINVMIRRSEKWIKDQRLATGENVPNDIVVGVETSELSIECRQRLIDYRGAYHDTDKLHFGNDYKPYAIGGYGGIYYCVDSASPTINEVDAAICDAFTELYARRAEFLAAEEARNTENARIAAEKEAHLRKFSEARELLKSELDSLKSERDRLRQHKDELSSFLATIPLDALRGAVKKQLTDESEISSRQNLIEEASSEWIFSNREDSDDE